MTLKSYGSLAEIWNVYFGDRSAEADFWFHRSCQYGKRVLAAMSATGEMAAALAGRGLLVTAVDSSREMTEEGRRLYGSLDTLSFREADLRMLSVPEQYDFAFIGSSDFHHFLTSGEREAVLERIGRHLRPGGGLAMELWYPSAHSWKSPWRRFEPLRPPVDPAVRVWKEGKTEYDAQTRITTITQEVYIQQEGATRHFPHILQMQLFDRDTMLAMFDKAGYVVLHEYGSYQSEPWTLQSPCWIVEAMRK